MSLTGESSHTCG